jgi:putative restriction endonuclease
MVNHEERAYRAWNILVALAPQAKLITYGELGKLLDVHPRVMRFILDPIHEYCRDKLPPLTILVVNKTTNEPGAGFTAWSHDDLMAGRTEVRNHDWTKEPNPFAFASDGTNSDDLVNRILSAPNESKEVFAKVKVRGIQQMIFRHALLETYNGRCALTGVCFEKKILDAAHIVPWSQCTQAQKIDPRNGILMLCCYHLLFDLGILSIDENYKVKLLNVENLQLTEADKAFLTNLQGKMINLPIN